MMPAVRMRHKILLMFSFSNIVLIVRRALPVSAVFAVVLTAGTVVRPQTPTPTPADPMPVAPTFASPVRPMPTTERVGVDNTDQLSLTLEQAVEMALKNNNDIEASRKDVKINEFNLRGARGIYDPLINSESYYESRTTPTASTIGGAVNGAVTQRQFFGNAGLSGFVPKYGGSYDVIFNSSRTFTTNRNSTLGSSQRCCRVRKAPVSTRFKS